MNTKTIFFSQKMNKSKTQFFTLKNKQNGANLGVLVVNNNSKKIKVNYLQ